MRYSLQFPSGTTEYYFNGSFAELDNLAGGRRIIVLTDANVYDCYKPLLSRFDIIVVRAGEQSKSWQGVNDVIKQLVDLEADRTTLLVAVGGGVITDLAGFIASIYMRGISFGFVPTTLLCMTDAAIGGKNGVNIGLYKNLIGVLRQPEFIIYETAFLKSLNKIEWSNGFAEIIKYGCVFDGFLFGELHEKNLDHYMQDGAIDRIVEKCADWKNKTVIEDEGEAGIRKLLNFGHTIGHAIENMLDLPHGFAVSIGMVAESKLSERLTNLSPDVSRLLQETLKRYHLPTYIDINVAKTMDILKMDKKRRGDTIDIVALEKIGKARVQPVPPDYIEKELNNYINAGDH